MGFGSGKGGFSTLGQGADQMLRDLMGIFYDADGYDDIQVVVEFIVGAQGVATSAFPSDAVGEMLETFPTDKFESLVAFRRMVQNTCMMNFNNNSGRVFWIAAVSKALCNRLDFGRPPPTIAQMMASGGNRVANEWKDYAYGFIKDIVATGRGELIPAGIAFIFFDTRESAAEAGRVLSACGIAKGAGKGKSGLKGTLHARMRELREARGGR